MAAYALPVTRTASTTLSTGTVASNASTPRRGELYDVIVGASAAPADNSFLWQLQRFTAPGTNTAVTPVPLDPADAASSSAGGQNNTVDATYTANLVLLTLPLNQRSSFRWWGADTGRLVYPATASNGIGLATPTASAVTINATIYFNER